MDSIKGIKRKFITIIAGLSLLFIVDMFYLAGLYNAIAEEMAKIALSCIEEADNEEIQYRLQMISNLSEDTEGVEDTDDTRTIAINKSVKRDTASASISMDMIILNQIVGEIRTTLHRNIDSMMPVNLERLNSLTLSNFQKKGIRTKLYFSEIVDLKTGTVKASTRDETSRAGNHPFVYEYDTENRYAYKVYTASMAGSILKRTSGIIATTLLIIVLLGYAFWYFIRTVVQLKSLEEMKSDFTNNMTHELKTPIAVAYSAIDTLLNYKQGEDREKSKQYLNICLEQLTHLHELVEQILSASMERSKKIALQKEDIILKPVIAQIIHNHTLRTNTPMDVHMDIQPETLVVHVDKTHLNNILNNLIDNAIKYALSNVKIRVKAYMEKGHCIIIIKDNGQGISQENQKLIFDKFYRVPQGNLHNVKGYGLGLYYVKTMVEQHCGEITVKSALHEGSEFMIKLPVK